MLIWKTQIKASKFSAGSGASVVEVGISRDNLALTKSIVILVEWVRAWGSCRMNECLLQLSVAAVKGAKNAIYSKEATESNWKKTKNRAVSIFVTGVD